MRTFQLNVDGRTIVQAGLALDKSTLIGLVTWESLSYDLLLTKVGELIGAKSNATITLGTLTRQLTETELGVFDDFMKALRLGNSSEWRNPQKACSLLADIGMAPQPYRYIA